MNSPLPDPSSDEPVDAHLRAALRHAPDANATPPAALSAAILSQARAAATPSALTRTAPAATAWPPLRWLLQTWWALSHPALATGLASVMVATVVGLMWWDRVPDEAGAPRELSKTKSAPSAPPHAQLEEMGKLASASAPPSPATNPTLAVADAAKPATARAQIAAENTETKTGTASNTAEQRRAVTDVTPTGKPVVVVNNSTARAEAPSPAAPAVSSEAATPTVQTDAPAVVTDASADQRLALKPPPAPPLAKSAAAVAPSAAPPPAASTEREVARLPGTALGTVLSSSLPAPLTVLREALQNEPERWGWRQNAGPAVPVIPALQAWLNQVELATAGRWAPQLDLRGSDKTAALLILRWTRDVQTAHTLVLRPDGLSWQPAGPGASAWFAPMDAAMVKRLMETLP